MIFRVLNGFSCTFRKVRCYVSGCITRKDDGSTKDALVNDTNFFYQKYGRFVKSLERDQLNITLDSSAQGEYFAILFSIFWREKIQKVIPEYVYVCIRKLWFQNVKKVWYFTLSKIFLKIYCLYTSPKSGKEPILKVLKLFITLS